LFNFGFIIEKTLGHVTHGLNLQERISSDPTIQAEWGFPTWKHDGLVGKLPVVRSNWTLQAGLQTRMILRDFYRRCPRLDALFFHTQVTAVLSPDWLRRFPSIVSLDATPRQYDRLGAFYGHSTGPAWLENWKWRLNRDCFRLARHIVTWSEWTKQGLVEEYEVPAAKVTVIPPGVDTRSWTPPESNTSKVGPVRILFVGGDLERKGGRILLEAFRQVQAQVPAYPGHSDSTPVELHLVTRTPVEAGSGIFVYSDLEPNSAKLKTLFFQSDIFCLPTLGDCLPMVLAEAGAAGLPTVSTTIAATPEIIQEGETGFLVPPGDVKALTEALQRLIQDPQLRLRQGQAARQAVCDRFDAGRNAGRLLDLMKQISAAPREARL
jgi:glycosyltransferase involved in cell wall biosynthesis